MIVIVLFGVLQIGLLVALGWIWLGRRPTPAKFAAAQGLTINDASRPLVQTALRLTYLGRVIGAPAGAVTLVLIAWGLGVIVAAPYFVILGLVGGTMVGVVFAQHRAAPAPGSVRQASLTARTVADYSPNHAAWSIAITAIACAGCSAWVAISAPVGLGAYTGILVIASAAVLVVPFGRRLQRRVVEAPRGDADAAVDDALRATAVRTVHHAMLGVLCCGIVLAGLTGALTRATLGVVTADGHVVFRAPPGSTSISADTGLRQAGNPNAPIRVFWTEADGSEHESGPLRVDGDVQTETLSLAGPGVIFGWASLLIGIEAIVQGFRATSAWKRGGPGKQRTSKRRTSKPKVAVSEGGVPGGSA